MTRKMEKPATGIKAFILNCNDYHEPRLLWRAKGKRRVLGEARLMEVTHVQLAETMGYEPYKWANRGLHTVKREHVAKLSRLLPTFRFDLRRFHYWIDENVLPGPHCLRVYSAGKGRFTDYAIRTYDLEIRIEDDVASLYRRPREQVGWIDYSTAFLTA